MSKKVSYWVAGHLTGIFEIRDMHPDPLFKGSRGAGLSINRGVITTIQPSKRERIEIYYDHQEISRKEALVTSKVLDLLGTDVELKNFQISHEFEIPLSSGYGASAAGALGTAFAVNEFLDLGYPDMKLFQIAHTAEVLARGGLGDIIGLYQGGAELRIQEGAPGIGKTVSLNGYNEWNIGTVHLGPLKTSLVLTNSAKRAAINKSGTELISELQKKPTFENFIFLCAKFTKEANLASPRLKQQLTVLPASVFGGQIMLGEAFFIFYRNLKDIIILKKKIPINYETICENTIKRCN